MKMSYQTTFLTRNYMKKGTYTRTKEIKEKNRTSQSKESRVENAKNGWNNKRKVAHSIFMATFKHSDKTKKGLSNIGKTLIGTKNPNWKGGITPEDFKIRNSIKSIEWRDSIFKRDDYTCQECGEKGGKLHADHTKPFSYFPELRFELSNGRTLCIGCHKKTETYAGKVHSWAKKHGFCKKII